MRKNSLLNTITFLALMVTIVSLSVIIFFNEIGAPGGAYDNSGVAPTNSVTPHVEQTTVQTVTSTPVKTPEPTPEPTPVPVPEDINITMNFAGDFLMHDIFFKQAKKTDGTYDFTRFFDQTANFMKDADFTVANLETTFAGAAAGYSGYPRFNTPDSLCDTMKDLLGIDMILTVNNHCIDKGFEGLKNTLKVIDERGLYHTGTYADKESSEKVQIIEIKGVKFSFLAYTYSLNGLKLPAGSEFAANMINYDKIQSDAQKAREAGAEYIICLPHWGVEYALTESATQRKQAKWIFENTEVDMIVGGHPHVVEPADYMTVTTKDGKEKTGFILYSLGNFISSHGTRKDYADTGIVLNVALKKDGVSGKIDISSIQYIPVVIDYTKGDINHNRLVGMQDAIVGYENGSAPTITKAEYDKFMMYKKYYKGIFEKAEVTEKIYTN